MAKLLSSILKNLFKKPATRNYPKEYRGAIKNSRGHLVNEIDKCIFCGICSLKCPANALAVNKNPKSWTVDYYKCIVCGYCTEVCPKKCLHMDKDYIIEANEKNARSSTGTSHS